MLNAQEIGVVMQMFKDGKESIKDKGFTLNEVIATKTKELIVKYQTNIFDIGMAVISSHFSANGGTFTIYDLQEVKKDEKGILDFDVENNVFKELNGKEIGFMIEPSDYGYVEPYNRQQPYYFCSYGQLDKKEYPNFNLYTKKKIDFNRRTFKRLDKYSYNPFWKTISFDMLIEKDKLVDFMVEFLELYQMGNMSDEIVGYINDWGGDIKWNSNLIETHF